MYFYDLYNLFFLIYICIFLGSKYLYVFFFLYFLCNKDEEIVNFGIFIVVILYGVCNVYLGFVILINVIRLSKVLMLYYFGKYLIIFLLIIKWNCIFGYFFVNCNIVLYV